MLTFEYIAVTKNLYYIILAMDYFKENFFSTSRRRL